MNIVLGIVGAIVFNFLFGLIGIQGTGWLGSLVAGFVGACILIAIARMIRGPQRLRQSLRYIRLAALRSSSAAPRADKEKGRPGYTRRPFSVSRPAPQSPRIKARASSRQAPFSGNANKSASGSDLPAIRADSTSAAMVEKVIPFPPNPITAWVRVQPGTRSMIGSPVVVIPNGAAQL